MTCYSVSSKLTFMCVFSFQIILGIRKKITIIELKKSADMVGSKSDLASLDVQMIQRTVCPSTHVT